MLHPLFVAAFLALQPVLRMVRRISLGAVLRVALALALAGLYLAGYLGP